MQATRFHTVVLLLVAATLVVSLRSATAAEYAIQPAEGPPGTTFTFYATGFGANDAIAFWATDPNGTIHGSDSYRIFSSNEGRADWQWVAPPDAAPGFWTMVAQDVNDAADSVTIPFTIVPVTESSPPPPANTSANVAPGVGAPGTRFTFYATGFKSKEMVGYWFNAPDGRIYSDNSYRARTSHDSSRVDWSWIAPVDAAPGIWQCIVRGEETGVERSVYFEIRGTANEPGVDAPVPDIAVTPSVGGPRTTFAFYATGFKPGERVSYWAVRPDNEPVGRDRYVVYANDAGRADWYWRPPDADEATAMPGMWQMVALGNDSDVTRVIAFEIRPDSTP